LLISPSSPYALVLAHGDDEIGALPFILANPPDFVLYLTDGSGIGNKSLSQTRFVEIGKSWQIISRKVKIIHFGLSFGISDGNLHAQLTPDHIEKLILLLSSSGVKTLMTTYAEGGHQDHDTSFMLSQFLSLKLGMRLLSFSLYSQSSISNKFFSVMQERGAGERIQISKMHVRANSLFKALRLMLNYRSQLKTWAGLGLPVLFSMTRRFVFLKPSLVTLADYPESDKLFYHSRRRAIRGEVISSWSKLGII